jgi:hypothetical protein
MQDYYFWYMISVSWLAGQNSMNDWNPQKKDPATMKTCWYGLPDDRYDSMNDSWIPDHSKLQRVNWCLVWITLVYSWVLPLVLGLDAWVFSLHLQAFLFLYLSLSLFSLDNSLISGHFSFVKDSFVKIILIREKDIFVSCPFSLLPSAASKEK